MEFRKPHCPAMFIVYVLSILMSPVVGVSPKKSLVLLPECIERCIPICMRLKDATEPPCERACIAGCDQLCGRGQLKG